MQLALRAAAAIGLAGLLWANPASANCSKGPFSGAYVGGTVGAAALQGLQHPFAEKKINIEDASLVGGLLAGYGWQCDRWVFGVEADINYMSLESNATQTGSYYRTTVDWFGTVRGRLGTTIRKDVLLYGTAGWAFADRAHRFEDNTITPVLDIQKGWASGFVYGGGIEMLRSDRHVLRFEALYVDLGKTTQNYSAGCCFTTSADWKDAFLVARVGLSIKLGEPERTYKPLK